jgi:hypothetical protein
VTLIDKRNECIDVPQSVSGADQMQSARRCSFRAQVARFRFPPDSRHSPAIYPNTDKPTRGRFRALLG